MKKLKLSSEEKNNINVLLKIGRTILETENLLIKLETNNQLNSQEYNSVLNRLQTTLSLEENLLNNLFSSPEKIIVFFNEYGDPFNTNDFNKQLETFIKPTEYNLTLTRIINFFYDKIVYEEIDKNNSIQAFSVNTKTGNSTLLEPDKHLQLDEIIKSDIIYTIINLLSTEIDNCNNPNLKEKLIKSKYNLLFMFPKIEKEFINNKVIAKELYISNEFFASFFHIDEKLYHSILFQNTVPLINLSINPLANMTKQDFITNNHLGKIYTILLRSGLLINEKDFYNSLKEQTIYQSVVLNMPNNEGVLQILNILENLKIDKEIPKTITLAIKKKIN